jgi:hypothetical protein
MFCLLNSSDSLEYSTLHDFAAFTFEKSCFDDVPSFHSLFKQISLDVGSLFRILSQKAADSISY